MYMCIVSKCVCTIFVPVCRMTLSTAMRNTWSSAPTRSRRSGSSSAINSDNSRRTRQGETVCGKTQLYQEPCCIIYPLISLLLHLGTTKKPIMICVCRLKLSCLVSLEVNHAGYIMYIIIISFFLLMFRLCTAAMKRVDTKRSKLSRMRSEHCR